MKYIGMAKFMGMGGWVQITELTSGCHTLAHALP